MPIDDGAQLRADLQLAKRRRAQLRKKVQLLNRRLRRANNELSALAAEPYPAADPDLGYVFIVTYGRSGSTLLQGILSSTPGWLIRGENGDAMRPLYEFHRSGIESRERRLTARERPMTDPWFGMDEFPAAISLRQLRALALTTILRPEADTRVVGFKEIRWWRHDDLLAYADFLCELFPGAQFVVNTRNLEDVAQSKWWADLDDPVAELTRHEQRILELYEHLGDSAYHMKYDEYVADPDSLAGLFDWLGETYEPQRIREVLAKRHSY